MFSIKFITLNFQLRTPLLIQEHVIIINFLISLILPLCLILINLILYKKYFYTRNKPSAFECGFEPKILARIPFSLKFYIISIIFLIFDIEIALILPIPIITSLSYSLSSNLLTRLFLLILLSGLIFEWIEGALKWIY